MTQQQIGYMNAVTSREQLSVTKKQAEASRMQAEASMKQAQAAERQAALQESRYDAELGIGLFGTVLGIMLAFL